MNYNSEGKCHYVLLIHVILISTNILYVSLYIYSLLEILGYTQVINLKQVLLRSLFSMTFSSIVMLWKKKVVEF